MKVQKCRPMRMVVATVAWSCIVARSYSDPPPTPPPLPVPAVAAPQPTVIAPTATAPAGPNLEESLSSIIQQLVADSIPRQFTDDEKMGQDHQDRQRPDDQDGWRRHQDPQAHARSERRPVEAIPGPIGRPEKRAENPRSKRAHRVGLIRPRSNCFSPLGCAAKHGWSSGKPASSC